MPIQQQRIVEEFTKLVRIDSPSFGERQMADYLSAQLATLGFKVSEDGAGERVGGSSGNLYARLEGSLSLPPLLFCAHMDTVEPSSGKQAVMTEDGTIRSKGQTVLGADDYAGITAILEAVRAVKEEGTPHRTIEVLFTVAEEVYCRGAGQFDFSQVEAREAYVLDLTGEVGTAAYRAPTILSFSIVLLGRASHAGFAPEQGIHAIRAAADAIARLPMGKLNAATTLNIGVIQGGQATNIIPDQCEVSGEIRSYSHQEALETAQMVREGFENAAHALGATMRMEVQTGCLAYETPLEHAVVLRFRKACEKLGIPCILQESFGGSDQNVLAQHGIRGLVLACAMHQCHSCEEYTTVDELQRIAAITKELMTSGGC